jgi:hypothetical protein
MEEDVTDIAWADALNRGIELFGDAPSGGLESDLIQQFKTRPDLFLEKMEELGRKVRDGTVRSGWAVLRTSLRGVDPAVVDDGGIRTKRERAARALIRNAGLYYEKPDQIIDELFEGDGLLAQWRSDVALQAEMVAYWQELRPLGIQAEAESLAYQQKVYNGHAI